MAIKNLPCMYSLNEVVQWISSKLLLIQLLKNLKQMMFYNNSVEVHIYFQWYVLDFVRYFLRSFGSWMKSLVPLTTRWRSVDWIRSSRTSISCLKMSSTALATPIIFLSTLPPINITCPRQLLCLIHLIHMVKYPYHISFKKLLFIFISILQFFVLPSY